MKTQIFNSRQIKKAASLIKEGELVAFPTETVYGLGADALNPEAIKKIFKAKRRPSDNPLIVHIADIEQLHELAYMKKKAKLLIDRFWPGPLTIILKKKKIVPDIVTAGMDSVALRLPSNRITLDLIRLSGKPIAAPSANLSGKPSPTTFEHVYQDMDGRVSGMIRSGSCDYGVESTVVDLTSRKPLLLRPGGLSLEKLQEVLPDIKVYEQKDKQEKVRSPGMKYRHYSPDAKVILFELDSKDKIKEYKKYYEKKGKRAKILRLDNSQASSKNLFRYFREYDKKGYDYILVKAVEEQHLGLAMMNRLRKAASRIIRE